MARKIFVSYKHSDSSIWPLKRFGITTARDYVDQLEQLFRGDFIYKGERDGDDFGAFKDETIESHLRDKIFDSSVTIVLISKNMKEPGESEDEQWIPWEISYSLKEKTREDKTSTTNAMLAVVLPDENGSYQYFIEQNSCLYCNTINWKINTLFNILCKNMFNRKIPRQHRCPNSVCNRVYHIGDDHSYIYPVKWNDFISDINKYVDLAIEIQNSIGNYDILKTIG